MSLKAVVVDDEQLAREELIYMLEQMPNLEVIGQAGNGLEAIGVVERVSPDVLFLDVQMPGLNGFEVANRLIQNGTPPSIVFVTAFDRHAIEAFDVNAVDYLLKPVEAARLEKAVERARQRLAPAREAPLNDQVERIVQLMAERQSKRERVAVKVGERFCL
jgi:DNA-binding LytR/AlgR family response regulator